MENQKKVRLEVLFRPSEATVMKKTEAEIHFVRIIQWP